MPNLRRISPTLPTRSPSPRGPMEPSCRRLQVGGRGAVLHACFFSVRRTAVPPLSCVFHQEPGTTEPTEKRLESERQPLGSTSNESIKYVYRDERKAVKDVTGMTTLARPEVFVDPIKISEHVLYTQAQFFRTGRVWNSQKVSFNLIAIDRGEEREKKTARVFIRICVHEDLRSKVSRAHGSLWSVQAAGRVGKHQGDHGEQGRLLGYGRPFTFSP